MKRLQIWQKFVYEKPYVYEIAAMNLSNNLLPEKCKKTQKTCKPNNHNFNRE